MRLTTISTAAGFLFAVAAVHAFPTTFNGNTTRRDTCPQTQYACPECPDGSVCVYPDSGGCPGAGIPSCQATNCFGLMCLIRSLPCPEECPYACKYNGPACCPFAGGPVCDTTCEDTHCPPETPCPDDCPDDCVYPEATNPCCPHMGEPVCQNKPTPSSPTDAVKKYIHSLKRRKALDTAPWSEPPTSNWFYQPKHSAPSHAHGHSSLPSPAPVEEVQENKPKSHSTNWFYQPSQGHETLPSHWVYQPRPGGLPIPTFSKQVEPTTQSNWFYQPSSSWYYEPTPPYSSWFYQPEPSNQPDRCAGVSCPPLHDRHSTWRACTTQYLHEDDCCPSLKCDGETPHRHTPAENPTPAMDLATSEDDPVLCADYIIPCPDECPQSCVYPTNAACPYQHQPACPPTQPIVETTCIETERFIAPPSPPPPPPATRSEEDDDDDDDFWGSLWHGHYHHSTASPIEPSSVPCPMIMYLCPPECPDDCIRPEVSCPYAEPATCPRRHHNHDLSAASVNEDDTKDNIEKDEETDMKESNEGEGEEDKEENTETDSDNALDSHAVCASLGLGTLPPSRRPFDGAVPLQHLEKRKQDCQDVHCPAADITCDADCDHCCLTSNDCCVQPVCVHA